MKITACGLIICLGLVMLVTVDSSDFSDHLDDTTLSSLKTFRNALATNFYLQTDLVFLLDESTSVRKHNFPSEIKLAESLGRLFRVSPNDTRIAVITYSTGNRLHFNFLPTSDGNMCNFVSRLKDIDYKGGWTFTRDALVAASSVLDSGRPNSKKVIILISDGRSNEADPISLANALKKQNVIIFTVGIGDADPKELASIASSPSHLYMIRDFPQVQRIIDNLRQDYTNALLIGVNDRHLCSSSCSAGNDCCDENAVCACGLDGKFSCACRLGYYGAGARGKCHKCPRATFTDRVGQEACQRCPPNSNTSTEGSTKLSDCTCNLGYRGNPGAGGLCRAFRCAKLFPPAEGVLLPTKCGNDVHESCSFFCRRPFCPYDGREPSCALRLSGKQQHPRTCSATGSWTGTEFSCHLARCPLLKSPQHGIYRCERNSTVNSQCGLECEEGFRIAGGTGFAKCLINGTWEKDMAHCEAVTCKPLKLTKRTQLEPYECAMIQQSYQSTCFYTCVKRLDQPLPTAISERVCGADGNWMGGDEPPTCRDSSKLSMMLSDHGAAYQNTSFASSAFCNPNPCRNGGVCSPDSRANKIICSCQTGFTGMMCENNLDDCGDHFCLNNGTCVDGIDDYSCLCHPGFEGARCETNIDDCYPGACINGGTCLDGKDRFHCKCPEGLEGESCEIVPNHCHFNPCLNGGRCIHQLSGFNCCCPVGFSGTFCEMNIDDCNSAPCLNGALCRDGVNNYTCICAPGFFGSNCGKDIDNCFSDPCANGATCVDLPNNYSCVCQPGFTGRSCESELPDDFVLIFPGSFVSNYALIKYERDLRAVTVAFWMQVLPDKNDELRGTPVSFSFRSAFTSVPNALTWYDFSKFILYIHGNAFYTSIDGVSDHRWHHYALTWDSFDGKWAAYKDGSKAAEGSAIGVGLPLENGIIVLGQEQDSVGGGFSQAESFSGKLAQFNVWDFVLTAESILQISRSCGHHGNVFAWPRIKDSLFGEILVAENSSLCKVVGKCSNTRTGCYCGGELHSASSFCEYRIFSCSPNPCLNNGDCEVDSGGSSYCKCSSSCYTGDYCQYYINRCALDNGNCSHICVNTGNGYHCDCPSGFYLTGDGRICDSVSYCMFQEAFYGDGEEWTMGCEHCRCWKGRVKCRAMPCAAILVCLPGERIVLIPGECCRRCISFEATCLLDNTGIITTFDGFRFKFPSTCRHTLALDCSTGSVNVTIENDQRSRGRKLIVVTGCLTVEISSTGKVLIDDAEISLPFVQSKLVNIYAGYKAYPLKNKIERFGKSANVYTIVLQQGTLLLWNTNRVVSVSVAAGMKKRMCGLCGNFNGDITDDLLTRSFRPAETFSEFVLSWRIQLEKFCHPPVYDLPGRPSQKQPLLFEKCQRSGNDWRMALNLCQPLRLELFNFCSKVVNSLKFYELCLQDVCACQRDNLCQCNAISSYILQCEKNNITFGNWNDENHCASQCQNGMVFDECGPSCPRTCNSITDIRCEIQSCKVGCHCPYPLVLHQGLCIEFSQCPNNVSSKKFH